MTEGVPFRKGKRVFRPGGGAIRVRNALQIRLNSAFCIRVISPKQS